ncbi:EPIDERMAL PATTERNING FACTOR-like protein 2 isoform X2 [Oryza brachyantha]|nr:EPIDERMAL PATTERNING FACTOR-like protein 2 isoform X2 [Oryza brachyantha]
MGSKNRPGRWIGGGSKLAVACLAAVAVTWLQLCCRSGCFAASGGGDEVRRFPDHFGRLDGAGAHSGDLLEEEGGGHHAGRRLLSGGPGSHPPRCTSKCGSCSPCSPVHVSVPPGVLVTTEYYPEAWRCKCRNRLYMP